MTDSYEKIRERNIAANRKLLLSLNLSAPIKFKAPDIPKPVIKKRKRPATVDEESPKLDEDKTDEPEAGGRRKSLRIRNLDLKVKIIGAQNGKDESESDESLDDSDEEKPRKPQSGWYPPADPKRPKDAKPFQRSLSKKNRPDPKVFGHQIGSEVGDWWESRMSCSQAGVHAPPVSGIAGSESLGCFSVALSGGYEDDVDMGYAFTYTGSGGRALSGTTDKPKNLRTAPQTFDQTFTGMNASLQKSCETKEPVRVIRGYKNHSPFAPNEGYRYDGLYRVEKCWREAGQSGYQVCKFAFVRLPGQAKIPVQEDRKSEAESMYKEMGFDILDLPTTPTKGKAWTKSLANCRVQQRSIEKPDEKENEEVEEKKYENLE